MGIEIAIDGPSGSGKSTIAKALAKHLGFVHIDTGAMYRAVALAAVKSGLNLSDEAAVLEIIETIDIDIKHTYGSQHVFLGKEDVTAEIRTAEMGLAASKVSAYAGVREKLVNLQRKLAAAADVVMDGRDIGTVVLANADVKIFLVADVEVRTERRCKELESLGHNCNHEEIAAQIIKRDIDDSSRDIAPLKPAEDAVRLDVSRLDVCGAVAAIIKIAEERGVSICIPLQE